MTNPFAPPGKRQPPGKPRPPLKRQGATPPNLTPEQKKAFVQLRQTIGWFTLTTAGAFALALAPLPWPIVGLAGAVGAVGFGIFGLVRARRLPGGGPVATSFAVGLTFAGIMLAYSALLAVQWPAQWNLQECLTRALTEQASDTCLATYQRESQSIAERLIGTSR
ncbi:MAG: hypothetical protein LBK59_05325 [Bifidobacteriaceae bacterium]|nr:hypothetical protein [Bifidobacteriaceae bacterium]